MREGITKSKYMVKMENGKVLMRDESWSKDCAGAINHKSFVVKK